MTPSKTTTRRLGAILLAAWLPLAATAAHAAPTADELAMPARSQPYQAVAEQFIASAAAADLDGARSLLSRQLVERSGREAIDRVLGTQILPFFGAWQGPGRSVTVTQTTDAAGQAGYAFYMWMQPRDGSDPRPFTVYVVAEQGRARVANIVPDRLVHGRHR